MSAKRFVLACSLFIPAAAAAADLAARTYEKACGACHAAFAPSLLPVESWEQLLGGLGRHFGRPVSLDAAARDRITIYLAAHAGKLPAPLRINGGRSPRDSGGVLPTAR